MSFPKTLKAFLIDFDGTLIDSMPYLLQAYRDMLIKRGVKPSDKEFNELIGPTIQEVAALLKKRHGLQDGTDVILKEWRERLLPLYQEKMECLPGALDTILHLKKKWKLALVTSADKELVETFLKKHRLYFDAIVCKDDKVPSKPSPMPYSRALTKLKILPEEAIAVEDSVNGILSASGAGVYTLMLSSKGTFQDSPKVRTVADWKEIMQLIERHYG